MINKIAAGEVVERPASVVKELVENSIDAEASLITIEIVEGGISLIRVSDNGTGIAPDDVERVFLQHATSKIETLDDLEGVMTLGFRGEAMSAIGSVSLVEMVTKRPEDETGILIEIRGGEKIKTHPIGSVNGTSTIVRDLFYNVPARRKFLKKPSVEGGQITALVERFVLANPKISFKYILNGKKILDTKSGDLKTAIFHVYGRNYYNSLLKLNNKADMHIHGYIGKPEVYRPNRAFGNFFINGRYIKSSLLQNAVEEAYKTKLPTHKFPVYAINIDIDPHRVDINVHPTKLEVRFDKEEEIAQSLNNAVNKILNDHILIPKYDSNKKSLTPGGFALNTAKNPQVFREGISIKETRQVEDDKEDKKEKVVTETPISLENFLTEDMDVLRIKLDPKHDLPGSTEEPEIETEEPEIETDEEESGKKDVNEIPPKIPSLFKDYIIIGQMFFNYWAIQQNNSLYLIDQHAAHERILYDKISQYFENDIPSQVLVSPVSVQLSSEEEVLLWENMERLNKLGFEIEEFGHKTFAIRAAPFIFESINPGVFLEILNKISTVKSKEEMASLACRAAVKAGDSLNLTEAKSLIDQLVKTANPFTCPHGRPTIVEFTKYQIEKMFKRV